jgi:hypothetical protein
LSHFEEFGFGLLKAIDYGLVGIIREHILLYNKVVEVVAEEFGADMSPMSIIHTKERALGPLFMFAIFWLDDVEDDGDPVLVIGTYEALIGVGGICPNYAIPLQGTFSGLVVGYDDAIARLQCKLLMLIILISLMYHL